MLFRHTQRLTGGVALCCAIQTHTQTDWQCSAVLCCAIQTHTETDWRCCAHEQPAFSFVSVSVGFDCCEHKVSSPQSKHRATALQSISDIGRRQADTDVTVLNSDNAILFFVLSIMEISPERKFASSGRVECFLSVGRVSTDHRYPTPAVCFPSSATRPLIGSDPLPLLSGRARLPAIQSVGFHLSPSSSSFCRAA